MRIVLTVFLLMMTATLWSQKDTTHKGAISGIVKDSADDYALQSVTVMLYKKSDSTLINYHITGEDGSFRFSDIPFFTPVDLKFSFSGYKPLSRTLTLDTANRVFDFKAVQLAKSLDIMDEVVVKAVVPITMNGDTLEINPGAFRLDSNAVVEDMLRRVPGVTMWGDGTITVNGKTVNNVYVDGKPFFGGDPTLATQNLPKNAIEKIQVYSETDYSVDNIDNNPSDSLLTMNIKLREDKKFGYFGKVGAGMGTDDRYEVDASGMAFNKKFRGGIAASTNNINKSAGLQEMLRQSTYRNYNPNNRYVADLGNSGINKVYFIGGNMQYDFSEQNSSRLTNQLRSNYSFRTNNNYVTTETDSRNSVTGEVFLQDSKQETHSNNDAHDADINYQKRDQNKDFSINAGFNSSQNTRSSSSFATKSIEGGGAVSESSNISRSESSSNGINLSTSFRNRDDDDRNLKSFGVNYNLSYNKNESESNNITDFISYNDATENNYYNRRRNNNSTGFNTSLGANYNALKRLLFGNFALWNINMVLSNNVSFSRSELNSLVSDYDSLTNNYFTNDSLTNNNRLTRVEDRPGLRLSRSFSKRLSDRFSRYLNVAANIQGQFIAEKNESNFDYRNLDRSFNFFTPSVSASYNYQRFQRYTIESNLSGNSNSSIPSIDQLRPIVDTSTNTYNISLGNANLQPASNKSASFNFTYRREQPSKKADYNFNISSGITHVDNAIVDSSVYRKEDGRRTIYLINMDGRKVYNAGFRAGTSFKMKNNKVLQFNYSLNFSNTTAPNYVTTIDRTGDISEVYTVTRSNNLNNNLSVFYTLGDFGNVQASQAIHTNSSNQSGANLQSLKAVNYVTTGNLNISPIRDLTISNTINYVSNTTTGKTSTLWNAFATYRFLKSKQAEVKLSAMDILKKNQNINTFAGVNNLSTTVSNGLQQFFMLTLSYYPRKFGGGTRGRGGEGGERRSFERRGSDGGGRSFEGRGGGMRRPS